MMELALIYIETGSVPARVRCTAFGVMVRQIKMKNRVQILWLAGLTLYVSFTTYDTYRVLKNVETGQYYTLKYMEKSSGILYQLKHSRALSDAFN